MPRLPAIDPATATGEAKVLLGAVQTKIGNAPNIIRTLANSPAALKSYLSLSDALSEGKLSPKTREAIALTVAGANTCEYCASAHTAISKNLNVDKDEIVRCLAGHSKDPELDALLVFAKKIVNQRGFVSSDDLELVRKEGFDDELITEIVANVVANTFTNYLNHVAQTDIDFPKVELATREAA